MSDKAPETAKPAAGTTPTPAAASAGKPKKGGPGKKNAKGPAPGKEGEAQQQPGAQDAKTTQLEQLNAPAPVVPFTPIVNKEEESERGIRVSGLPASFTVDELKELAEPYGRVTVARFLPRGQGRGAGKKSAYIQYNSKVDAKYAAYVLNEKEIRSGQFVLSAEPYVLTEDDKKLPEKKKVEAKKVRVKKEAASLRFLSPKNPATDGPNPQAEWAAPVPAPAPETYSPPETTASFAPQTYQNAPRGRGRRHPPAQQHAAPEEQAVDEQAPDASADGWIAAGNRGRAGRGRSQGRGGRRGGGRSRGRGRRTEYVQVQPTEHFEAPKKQFKPKEHARSPKAPVEPELDTAPQHPEQSAPAAKHPKKKAAKPAEPGQASPAPQQTGQVVAVQEKVHVDHYQVVISHVRTKDPKVKIRLTPEQHQLFLKAIEQFLPK